jgi:hypothetical protein
MSRDMNLPAIGELPNNVESTWASWVDRAGARLADDFHPPQSLNAPTKARVNFQGAFWAAADSPTTPDGHYDEVRAFEELRDLYGKRLLDHYGQLPSHKRDAEQLHGWLEALRQRDLDLVNMLRTIRRRPDAAIEWIRKEALFYRERLLPTVTRDEPTSPKRTRGPDLAPRRGKRATVKAPAPPTPGEKRQAKLDERAERVLRLLRRRKGGLSQRDIRDLLSMGKAELTKALEWLMRGGLVEHQGSRNDSRYVAVAKVSRKPTPKKPS